MSRSSPPANQPNGASTLPERRGVLVVKKHHLLVRWSHWLNVPILLGLIVSGMSIYWASPVYQHKPDPNSGNFDVAADIGIWICSHIPGLHNYSSPPDWIYNHIGLGSGMLALALRLHFLCAYLFTLNGAVDEGSDEARMRHALERLSQWLGQAVTEGRAALYALRTSTTEENHLGEALRQAAEENCVQASMSHTLTVIGDAKDLHPIVRDEIGKIGYEAIRNACFHSHASRLEIELRYADDLTMSVKDNGTGIDPAVIDAGKAGHFGLQGMRERADRIRAKLNIQSASNAGTEIILSVSGQLVYRIGRISLRERVRNAIRRLIGRPNTESAGGDLPQ
jgi:hypothetical protein